jgi:RHS repeat-associated protein
MPGTATLVYDAVTSSTLAVVPVGADGNIKLQASTATDVSVDVVGWHSSPETGSGLVAHTITPSWLADTRDPGTGTCTPSPCDRLTANTPIEVQVAGLGGIPAGADAVAVVIHAMDPSGAYFGGLSAWPTGQPQPAGSTLTFGASWVSGTAIIPVGTNGRISIVSSADIDVAVQGIGWYEDSTETWTYTYTGDGLRRTKTAPDGTITTFTWDRSGGLPLMVAEAIDAPDSADDQTVRYLYGPTGHVVADITTPATGTETIRWYHRDQLGSTVALTDNTGSVIGTFGYSPVGRLNGRTGTETTPIGWAGEYHDEETGFTYLRARYYDTATAQFLTRDPIEAITRSAYGYVSNNPVNRTDPTGLFHYTLNFDLGESSQSPEEVFAYWMDHFAELFPVRGAPDKLADGSYAHLNAYGIPFRVRVSEMSSVGFRFNTLGTHPDYPGWIEFNIERTDDCHLNLRVHGYVPSYSAGGLLPKRLYRSVAGHTWGPLADNLRAYLHPGGGGGGGLGSW